MPRRPGLRIALLGSLISLMLLGAMGARMLVRVGVHEGYSPTQPIAFSHKLHAGDNQVPCLYCHFAATQSRHAGIPPANVCMNCHGLLTKQTGEIEKLRESVQQQRAVRWVKVHNLPDFVYFNHSQHVRAAVACQTCHGPVERMTQIRQEAPLTMGWCLDCHKQRHVGETETGTDCARCHY
jgi:hypothetical protein